MLIDQRRNQSIRKGSIVGDNKRQNDFRETRKWDELVFVLAYLAEIISTFTAGCFGICSPVVSMKGKK